MLDNYVDLEDIQINFILKLFVLCVYLTKCVALTHRNAYFAGGGSKT